MDSKDVWPVVKFLIAATGLKRRDARAMLSEIDEEKFSQLFLRARAWDRDQSHAASKQLGELLGVQSLTVLTAATRLAQLPSTETQSEDDDDEPTPARRKRKIRK